MVYKGTSAVLLLPLLIALLFIYFYNNPKLLSHSHKALSCVYAFSSFGLFVFAVTEILSIFRLLSFIPLLAGYLALIVPLFIYGWKKRPKGRVSIPKTGRAGTACFIALFFFACMEIALAVKTAPNNADSLAYHLPRMLQWIQNRTVAHYATNYVQQAAMVPLPEFFITHIYILTGEKDCFVNLVQCIAYFISGGFVFQISWMLTGKRRLAWTAVWMWYLCPIALAESLTTQTDLVAALWMVQFAYMVLYTIKSNILNLKFECIVHYSFFGVLVGLACNTKAHVLIGMCFFTVWLLVYCIRGKKDWKAMVILSGTALLAAFAVSVPEQARVYATFGTFFPEMGGSIMLVKTAEPRYLLMNLVKAFAYNLTCNEVPYTTGLANKIVHIAAYVLHVDMNDERITWHDFVTRSPVSYSHDCVPYPFITYAFLLACSCMLIGIIYNIAKKNAVRDGFIYYGYAVCTLSSYIVLMTVNRHVDANVRYQLVFICLLCPFIVSVFAKIKSEEIKNGLIGGAFFLLAFSCINQTLFNISTCQYGREGREKGYFAFLPNIYESYVAVTEYVTESVRPDTIGLHIPGLFEYPLRAMLNNRGDYLFYNIHVQNDTGKYESKGLSPDCLIYITYEEQPESLNYNNCAYHRILYVEDTYERYSVYTK